MRCSGWRHGLCETVRQYLVIRRQGGMKKRMQQLVWLLGVCGSLCSSGEYGRRAQSWHRLPRRSLS